MNTKRILSRTFGVAAATAVVLAGVATPASAGTNTGVSYASNGDGWANFVADGDNFFINDTKCDDDIVWAQLTWYKSEVPGDDRRFRTIRSHDGCANTEASMTKSHPWSDIPEGATVWVRACGSVGEYSNTGTGWHGPAQACGDTKTGKA